MTDETDDNAMIRLWRKQHKDKRASNRARSRQRLLDAGIGFEERNGGAHLIVGEWDFWPGTGLWAHRGPPTVSGRGVDGLIRRIKGEG